MCAKRVIYQDQTTLGLSWLNQQLGEAVLPALKERSRAGVEVHTWQISNLRSVPHPML